MVCGRKKTTEPEYVDKREVKHKTRKLWLWILWLLTMVVAAVYVALALITFRNVHTSVYDDNTDDISQKSLWALLLALLFPSGCAVLFFIIGTVVLLTKSVRNSGFSYSLGGVHFSALWLAILTCWGAVSLHSYKDTFNDVWENRPQGDWKDSYTAIAFAAMCVGYVTAGMYLILFFVMFLLRDALRKQYLDEVNSVPEHDTTTPVVKHHDHSDAMEAGVAHKAAHHHDRKHQFSSKSTAGGATRSQDLDAGAWTQQTRTDGSREFVDSPRATSSGKHQVASPSKRPLTDARRGSSVGPELPPPPVGNYGHESQSRTVGSVGHESEPRAMGSVGHSTEPPIVDTKTSSVHDSEAPPVVNTKRSSVFHGSQGSGEATRFSRFNMFRNKHSKNDSVSTVSVYHSATSHTINTLDGEAPAYKIV